MGGHPADARDAEDRRRFLRALVVSAVLFTWLGRAEGQDVAQWLQGTPTTERGWLFIGWLVAGPPYLLLVILVRERHRLGPRRRRDWAHLLGVWVGASMFVLPAKFVGIEDHFGTGAVVGYPLAAGWSWGALGNVVAIVFAGLLLLVLRRTVGDSPTPEQRALASQIIERAWTVLLVVSLGFALYGEGTGLFPTGT